MAKNINIQMNKNAATIAAREASRSPRMDLVAELTRRRIVASARRNQETGDFINSIKVIRDEYRDGIIDRVIYSDDPGAIAIEAGHRAPDGTLVPGQHHFRNVLRGDSG